MNKITYFGANGKVGRSAIVLLVNSLPKDNDGLEILLVPSNSVSSIQRLSGFIKDINGLVCSQNKSVKFSIVNDISEIGNSDIIICSAGAKINYKDKEYFKQFDNTGRLVQAYANIDMVINISEYINKYSPKSLFLLITNQVDILCELIRKKFKQLNVIGIGGFVDSIRLRQIIYEKYNIKTQSFIIGYHNNTMLTLLNSIKHCNDGGLLFDNYNNIDLLNVIQLVRDYGSIISQEQECGSSILPACAIVEFIIAYLYGKTLINPYNVVINDSYICDLYDILSNTSLSVPIIVGKNKIEFVKNIELLSEEKIMIKDCITKLKNDIEIINEYYLSNNKNI